MSTYYRPTWADISLDALYHNIEQVRKGLKPGTKILASVKANAYGHGVVEIARAAQRYGLDYLGVAFLDEALQLRSEGIMMPILVLGFVAPEHLELAQQHRVTVTLYREDQLAAASGLTAQDERLKVHIKVDTGMGRLGVLGTAEALDFIQRARALDSLDVEGIFTHYSKADEADKAYTALQYERFHEIERYVRQQGWDIPIIHAANSAGSMDTPQWTGDMVRLGIAMYGMYPSDEVEKQHIKLEPVLSLKTRLVHTKQVPDDWGISYGARYYAKQNEWIGTLPIGYADGFSRMLTGKAQVLLKGTRIPVVGAICMDQCMVSLEKLKQHYTLEELHDQEVVLIGKQGSECISMEEVADQIGTINYELTCALSSRVPRRYIENGKVIAISNRV
ncbi:alanine racemase [Paenibacillus montaniterrae]|uniref:Alanine racemase n=1 Tax=Paenibacillus montaniterrae TaxID=429341 RepID=A0A919YSP7_9BACL|nr:alanine racemase [Paenibacillus montaniterrae]GIP16601.1 alanine racemase [Paenibacillus montaniterrae]